MPSLNLTITLPANLGGDPIPITLPLDI
ncbi:hypothetical protein KIPB_010052, partial [Kipferlia bialata]|eukprot:g10052.t1